MDAAVARNEVVEPVAFTFIFGFCCRKDLVDATVARNEVVEPVAFTFIFGFYCRKDLVDATGLEPVTLAL